MFSVIIATYNGSQYIVEQLESVVRQSVPPDTVYIYDDCSTDGTTEIIADWTKEHTAKNIVLRRNSQNKGYARNFLDALLETDDEYIFLCDQDDVWHENKIELYMHLVQEAAHKTEPLLITSGYYVTDDKLNVAFNVHTGCKNSKEITLNAFLRKCSYPGMTFCINRALKDKIAKELEQQNIAFHDYFISLIAIKYGRMLLIQKPLVLYRQHGNNQIGVFGKKEKSRGHWKNVLTQKCLENEIALSVFPKNQYVLSKAKFGKARLSFFEHRSLYLIVLHFFSYKRFYGLKSFIADLYYSILRST